MSLDVVVSPYHLTTREAPAVAALLLASRVVTFLPTPLSGAEKDEFQRAIAISPRYLKFMDSLRWTMPLWDRGVIASAHRGQDAGREVRHVCDVLVADDRYATLRALTRHDLFEDEKRYLDAVSHDLLRGGPDPGISLPVAGGIDRFGARHTLAVCRSHATSIAQRVEDRLARRLLAIAIPSVLQGDAERIDLIRDELEEPLDELRAALTNAIAAAYRDVEEPVDRETIAEVEFASRAYTTAFEERRAEFVADAKDDPVRLVLGTITLTLALLPVDAVLRSGLTAMQTLTGPSKRGRTRAAIEGSVQAPALAVRDPLAGRSVAALIIKPLGRPHA
ncbi:MAG TPA: hypothetical protein VF777_15950 [Phycisphaerales bacterium]